MDLPPSDFWYTRPTMREYQIILSHKERSETSVVRVHAKDREDAMGLVGGSEWMVGRVDEISREESSSIQAGWHPDDQYWKQLRKTIFGGVFFGLLVWSIFAIIVVLVILGLTGQLD